jgi:hypothetical protein
MGRSRSGARHAGAAPVLDAGPSRPRLRLYAHCLPGHPGGVTLLAINTSRSAPEAVGIPISAGRCTLAAPKLEEGPVELNGDELALNANGDLPRLEGRRIAPGRVDIAPASITFFAAADANNAACR